MASKDKGPMPDSMTDPRTLTPEQFKVERMRECGIAGTDPASSDKDHTVVLVQVRELPCEMQLSGRTVKLIAHPQLLENLQRQRVQAAADSNPVLPKDLHLDTGTKD